MAGNGQSLGEKIGVIAEGQRGPFNDSEKNSVSDKFLACLIG